MTKHLGVHVAESMLDQAPMRRADIYAFALDEYPVTHDEWFTFIDKISPLVESPARKIDMAYWRRYRESTPCPGTAPIVGVSFGEASLFAWFQGGRLPTEEEWEMAARGPDCQIISEERVLACTRRPLAYPQVQEGFDPLTLLLPVDDPRLTWESPFEIKSIVGNASEWVDSVFDIRFTKISDRRRRADDLWTSGLSYQRIIKIVCANHGYPHPGGRGEMRTEKRNSNARYPRDIFRDPLVGFRCAYDLS